MATRKNMNHNTENSGSPKNVTLIVLDNFFDYNDFREKPVSQNFINRLCSELRQHANDPKSYQITSFFTKRGINRTTVMRWKEKFPDFKQTYEFAMHCIGVNRHEDMLTGVIREKPAMFMQSIYDPDWEAKEKVFADRALKNAAVSNAKFDVHMDDFAKSDAVPDKE